MPTRRLEGAALLVAGHGAIAASSFDASVVHTLGQIGESLLATGSGWQIRRLSPAAGERNNADRGTLKQHIDELVNEQVRVAMLVILGVITDIDGQPALVTSPQFREYPEDATLPFAWIRERLAAAKAEQVIIVMSARSDDDRAASWLSALATRKPLHLVAVDSATAGCPLVDALLTGVCGDALDPRTGTVTMHSLGHHLARQVPAAAIQDSDSSQTFATPPPLAGLWDVRRSQLSTRTVWTHAADGSEDLTGTVLPGRFRIDELVARGTFGTVYRARQLAVERDVAVKVLHADINPTSDDGRLFVQEVRAVGRIDHTNVVRIHQADITHDGRLFYAMELLGGRDLQQILADGPLSRARALDLVCQLLGGLAAAHDVGLVHADVKPANVIVVPKEDGERVVLVDFGLARLRSTESVGGTPAYMAPEQLHEGRVDARSDLFSAALVPVTLLTQWRRPNAYSLVPPLDAIDEDLRPILARAFAIDPGERYQAARELAAALAGQTAQTPAPTPAPRVPFRHLSPFTETDQGRLLGREADISLLVDHVLYRRSVIYTAPSGTGKTSVLRAGLLPRLVSLGVHAVYIRCRTDTDDDLANAIWAGETSVDRAIAQHQQQRGTKLVIVLDQVEAALARERSSLDSHDSSARPRDVVAAALGFDTWPADADVSIVLSIREDHLARLVARTQHLEQGIPIVRLPPLGVDGARAAIVAPLTEGRLAIEPELLDALLADLQAGAAALAPEMGWGDVAAVYPPHLQLACSVLYEALGSGEATLTLSHYRVLGGFDAIVGEHLDRVVETELAGGDDVIARDLFVALVTGHERTMRPEAELVELAQPNDADRVIEVLETLRARGLLVRLVVRGEPAWELVHDSLVPRVLAWIDRRDLARRRAVELVRYHLRRSRPEAPSLLRRAELRELRPYGDAIGELDAAWKKRNEPLTPLQLVAQSKSSLRRQTAMFAGAVVVLTLAITLFYRQQKRYAAEADNDVGQFTLELAPFDWDPATRRANQVPIAELSNLTWELRTLDAADPELAGPPFIEDDVRRGEIRISPDGMSRLERVQAHGGPAYLVVTGRNRNNETCAPSLIPFRVPGYAQRVQDLSLRIRIPTCRATRAGTVTIPAVSFIYGGVGDPPSKWAIAEPDTPPEQPMTTPAFDIDVTEVTNAAFAQFTAMSALTGIEPPAYLAGSKNAADPASPVSGITWSEARKYCLFIGKDLPTSQQWTKALRGGDVLPDGRRNPYPRRNLPWGAATRPIPANIKDTKACDEPCVRAVGSFPGDVSPYGVLDMAGNVSEWTLSKGNGTGIHLMRGGDYSETSADETAEFVADENNRPDLSRYYHQGVRCVTN